EEADGKGAIGGLRRSEPIRQHYFISEGMRAQAPCALLCCPGDEIVRLALDTVDCFARSWESGLGQTLPSDVRSGNDCSRAVSRSGRQSHMLPVCAEVDPSRAARFGSPLGCR